MEPNSFWYIALTFVCPILSFFVGVIVADTLDGVANYGYMQTIPKYMMFCGTIMFYGVASPELFGAIKSRVLDNRLGAA